MMIYPLHNLISIGFTFDSFYVKENSKLGVELNRIFGLSQGSIFDVYYLKDYILLFNKLNDFHSLLIDVKRRNLLLLDENAQSIIYSKNRHNWYNNILHTDFNKLLSCSYLEKTNIKLLTHVGIHDSLQNLFENYIVFDNNYYWLNLFPNIVHLYESAIIRVRKDISQIHIFFTSENGIELVNIINLINDHYYTVTLQSYINGYNIEDVESYYIGKQNTVLLKNYLEE